MAKKTIKAQMKQRRDTKANWAATNPVLLDGELGIVSDDPNLYKVGDGATAWNDLPFRGFDGTLAQELGTSPNAVISQKVVSEKLTELESSIKNAEMLNGYFDTTDADLDIADEKGNVILRLKDGNLATKNFQSKDTPKSEEMFIPDADLDIADEKGNILLRLKDGNIETKQFRSQGISVKRPYTPNWERFKVKINRTPLGKFDNYSIQTAVSAEDAEEDLRDCTGVIALPPTYTPNGKPTKVLMFAHGTSGNVTDTQWYNNNPLMIEHFVPFWLSKGYAVFDCNGVCDGTDDRILGGYASNPCGFPDTMQAYIKCYDYIVENYNVQPQIYVWGCSAGGPVGLNMLFMRQGSIAAIAECASIIDIKRDLWDVYDGNTALDKGFREDIAKRLGFDDKTGNTWESDKAEIWNPFARVKIIDEKKYAFGFNAPIFIANSTNDEYFRDFQYVREQFAEALVNGGSICRIKWYDGFDHDDCAMGKSDIVLNDVYKWFNRF